jgi:hypothetical protein
VRVVLIYAGAVISMVSFSPMRCVGSPSSDSKSRMGALDSMSDASHAFTTNVTRHGNTGGGSRDAADGEEELMEFDVAVEAASRAAVWNVRTAVTLGAMKIGVLVRSHGVVLSSPARTAIV